MSRQYGKTRGSGNPARTRKAPAESMEVFLPAVTFARAVQAAAEFGMGVDQLVSEATLGHLERLAGELFEREFRADQEAAAELLRPHVYREEYASRWRQPSWMKGRGGPQ